LYRPYQCGFCTSPAYSGICQGWSWLYAFSFGKPTFGVRCLIPRQDKAQKFTYPRLTKIQDIYQGNASPGITSLFDLRLKSGLADLTKTSAFQTKDGRCRLWRRPDQLAESRQYAAPEICHILLTNVNPTLAKSTITDVLTGKQLISTTTAWI